MSSRKPLTKTLRFEVFKRDGFKCQYCGRSAPEVILEIDHITPVAEGGENDTLNLITSCRDCNRGKGKRKLNDNSVIEKQRQLLEEAEERREQMEMMLDWRKALRTFENSTADMTIDYINEYHSYGNHVLSDYGAEKIRGLVKQFGMDEVVESTDISFKQYYTGTYDSWSKAIEKIGGICYNRKKCSETQNEQRPQPVTLDLLEKQYPLCKERVVIVFDELEEYYRFFDYIKQHSNKRLYDNYSWISSAEMRQFYEQDNLEQEVEKS